MQPFYFVATISNVMSGYEISYKTETITIFLVTGPFNLFSFMANKLG